MRKKFFLIVDTETTQSGQVADLGLVVMNRKGDIEQSWGLLNGSKFANREADPLFHIFGDSGDIFSAASLPSRYATYEQMVSDGRRFVSSVAGINRLIAKIQDKYRPVVTAYNLAFDLRACDKTGIDLPLDNPRFCLWHASVAKWGKSKRYRQFCLDNGFLGDRTKLGNRTLPTKADILAKFVLGPDLPDEPHTALEDARDYEAPILARLVATTAAKEYMNPPPYDWRALQVRDLFKPL